MFYNFHVFLCSYMELCFCYEIMQIRLKSLLYGSISRMYVTLFILTLFSFPSYSSYCLNALSRNLFDNHIFPHFFKSLMSCDACMGKLNWLRNSLFHKGFWTAHGHKGMTMLQNLWILKAAGRSLFILIWLAHPRW